MGKNLDFTEYTELKVNVCEIPLMAWIVSPFKPVWTFWVLL